MAAPLPAVLVSSLADLERLATLGSPCCVVLVGAGSISEARAMLSVLREKRLLRNQHGGVEAFPKRLEHLLYPDSDGEGEGEGEGEGGGAAFDLAQGPWSGGLEKAPDLRLLDDADLVGVDAEEGVGCHHDIPAHGWVVDNFKPFSFAIDVGLLLERVTAEILPALRADPADPAELHRLRNTAAAIRRVGKAMPGIMGHAPVGLANYLKRTATGALDRGIEGGGGAWMASRCDAVLARVLAVYDDEPVHFDRG